MIQSLHIRHCSGADKKTNLRPHGVGATWNPAQATISLIITTIHTFLPNLTVHSASGSFPRNQTTEGCEVGAAYGSKFGAIRMFSDITLIAYDSISAKQADLTCRDIQDIIIRSSLQIDRDVIVNTDGISFSFYFGFGLVKPDKMVELATSQKYHRLGSLRTCQTQSFWPNLWCDRNLNVKITSHTVTIVLLLVPRPRDTSNETLTNWNINILTTYEERSYMDRNLDIYVPSGVKTTLIS
ncbi:hypothetical protein RF11_00480 [Thelohanellus kitauei]|uniref:Uncharacterized protein n=1 Tax=Thelohanellus kitauei TaxID=669202 RepID=A0A0C2JDB5_THEKT|nr:hypothetical protein RF11_00480 [Thelohanellus kitauei]